MISPTRLGAIARKELLQLRRDVRSLILAFLLPLVLTMVFGAAISLDVREIPFAVLDRDRSPASRELVEAFTASSYFTLLGELDRPADADRLLRRGEARLILSIPPAYARDLSSGRGARVQALVDGSDANTATIAINYADAITAGVAARAAGAGQPSPITAEARVWYNEALESARTIVPGLVAVIMAIIAAMLTALTIAREWERGTMEQLAATPVRRVEVVVGKLVPYVAIGLIDLAMVTLLGVLVFDVPLRGNVLLLAGIALVFIIGMLSFGILISSALKSQLLATQIALMATYLPTFLLSGFIFAIANMPLVLRALSYLVPARYFVVVTRGIFLKDVGLGVLWPQVLGLVIYAAVAFALAVRAFRKELA
ncbi:MAG TPA: ABC transporter permease [Gemmatimonadales bacterium]